MGCLRLVLGDQLSFSLSALQGLDREADTVLMAEVAAEARYVRHHKIKIAFCFSAMRHFGQALRADGVDVRYVRFDEAENSGAIDTEIERACQDECYSAVVVTEPGEYRLKQSFEALRDRLNTPLEIRDDDRFIAAPSEFEGWARGRKELRMEYFYREMRKKTGFLMEGDSPVGGAWNFDKENRKPLSSSYTPPKRLRFAPDDLTQDILDLVEREFPDHFGTLEHFDWAVTHDDAKAALDDFIANALPTFGDYQDAMAIDEPFLSHGLVSVYLNVGLLDPRAVCEAAITAYESEKAPLNAVEGFIRQIIGWREYVRGLYWLKMPDYKSLNALGAKRPLPEFYWTGETRMNCLAQVVEQTRSYAYAHHIQRLMVTGNFALLCGLDPDAVNDWYMVVYADAYEWVELPNTHGMALYADGGIMASKPYAASGSYIDKMSDYCAGCSYSVKEKTGDKACPFNYLYWDFIARNDETLRGNPRMNMVYATYDKMSAEKRTAIQQSTDAFFNDIRIALKE